MNLGPLTANPLIQQVQIDVSSASNINSPIYLIAAHQKTQRSDLADATRNLSYNRFTNAIFDHVEVWKKYSEIDGIRYPKNALMDNYQENTNLEKNKDLKLVDKEYVGDQLLSPFITLDKMKNYYPIQIKDLPFQVDHISPMKTRLFEEYDDNPTNTNLL